jgi:hypothetical protein
MGLMMCSLILEINGSEGYSGLSTRGFSKKLERHE